MVLMDPHSSAKKQDSIELDYADMGEIDPDRG